MYARGDPRIDAWDTPETGQGHAVKGVMARARAPLRVSFSGGGTDLMPFAQAHGGLVLSATIARYAYATLRPIPERVFKVRSLDYHRVSSYGMDGPFLLDGKDDLVKACLRRLEVNVESSGLDLFLETYAPPSSGLGASSALVVAVIGTFDSWRHLSLDRYTIAQLAYDVERVDVGVLGGMQDQYAAAFGGFNLIEFRGPSNVIVNPLRIERQVIHELEYNSLLVLTGKKRGPHRALESQFRDIETGKPTVIAAFTRMKELTWEAKTALVRGRLDDLGEILHEEWLEKKSTSQHISTDEIDYLYDQARAYGALGGKVSGAGGGGFMYLLTPYDRKPAVVARLTELGADVYPVVFAKHGMQAWLTPPLADPLGDGVSDA